MIRTGTYIIEISRIKKSQKNPKFLSRVFSAQELKQYTKCAFNSSKIAMGFVAKEAVVKSLNQGFNHFTLADISILYDAVGNPYVSLSGNAKIIANREKFKFTISVNHCKEYATATVIAYSS